jgi:glycosyltransferase involved in cell wall biosynthesis
VRILMATDFYWPFVGGVEQHVRSLSAALAARGHSVAVATLQHGDLPAFERDGDVRVYRLRASVERASWLFKNPGRPWAPPVADPELALGLRRVIAHERPDVVHGHDWLARSFLPLKPWSGARLVVSEHYYTLSCAKKNLMYRGAPCDGPGLRKCLACASEHYGAAKGVPVTLGNWAMAAAERAAVDMFVSVSRATAIGNGLPAAGPRARVIPNFVPDDLGAADESEVAEYLAQLPPDGFLLFVGDLRAMKGLDVLLEAYRRLIAPPPLVLIGKVWPETPAELPPGVVVLRDWPNRAVMAAWRRCGIAVAPSVWPEPFGIVLIEAMASARPVVGSRIGGIPDIVEDGVTGLLVPPGDAEALRAALARLLADPALRERMGQAGLRRVERFKVAAVVPQIEQVYADVLAVHRAAHAGGLKPAASTTKPAEAGWPDVLANDRAPVMSQLPESAAALSLPGFARHTERQKKEDTMLPQATSAGAAPGDNIAGERPLVSIIINNYNYGRFLGAAIESALRQTYRPIEVIVVDDGSADESRAVIAEYAGRIRPVLKPNGGQASCFNAGFALSRGELVLFLDADDRLRPDVVERAVAAFGARPAAAKLQFRLALVDAAGAPTGAHKPERGQPLTSGDLRPRVLAAPDDIAWQPTSGNMFAARVLREILPMPEPAYRLCADYYLSNVAPLFGEVLALDEVGGDYRVHGANNHHAAAIDLEQTRQLIARTGQTHAQIRRWADVLGLPGFPPADREVLSVTFLAHRLASLRLDPARHPIRRDRRARLVRLGVAAARRRRDLAGWAQLAYIAWFMALALAPRPLARWLAARLFFPAAGRARQARRASARLLARITD